MTRIELPDPSLVVLVGPAGAGKSTFARTHFAPTEVISSDACRALVCDDEANMEATKDAFDLVHFIASKRLARRRLTVIDATNVLAASRAPLVRLAKTFLVPAIAIVLDVPEDVCRARNRARSERAVGEDVVRKHAEQLRGSMMAIDREGFERVFVVSGDVMIERR